MDDVTLGAEAVPPDAETRPDPEDQPAAPNDYRPRDAYPTEDIDPEAETKGGLEP